MLEKIIFLIQFYFCVSIMCTLIFLGLQLPEEIKILKIYKIKRTWKDNLCFARNIIILLLFFPIIAFWYGIKEM